MLYYIRGHENIDDCLKILKGIAEPLGISIIDIPLKNFSNYKIPIESYIHFATNDFSFTDMQKILSSNFAFIFNRRGWPKWTKKSELQLAITAVGVPTPIIFKHGIINDIIRELSEKTMFPFYIKYDTHETPIELIVNESVRQTYIKNLNTASTTFGYLEQAIIGREQKIYWVIDEVFCKQGESIIPTIKSAMQKIHAVSGFDFFSADFVINKNNCYCIDINPATSGFRSNEGLRHLILKIADRSIF